MSYNQRRHKVFDVTLTLDTSQYATGDALADTQEIAACMNNAGGGGSWTSCQVIDKDDQGANMKVYLFGGTVTFGTENSAVSISDADLAECLGYASVDAWEDLGGVQLGQVPSAELGFPVQAKVDSRSLFVAVESEGTGTYTASGVVVRLGFDLD
jgi:hypothetical protein